MENMALFVCGCCGERFPTIHKNVHHKIPRSLGGKDIQSNLIELCPGCHDALHAIAYRMMSKKVSRMQVLDSIALIYPQNKKAQELCLELALNVRNAMIDSQEKGLGPDHIVNLTTTLRMYYKPLIANRIRELNTSQENYIRGLILSDLAKRFNLQISLVEEKMLMDNIKKQKSVLV